MDAKTAHEIEQLHKLIADCPPQGMVFFGGAGVSTESGIPDFRSTSGLFNSRYPYPPEEIVSHHFFNENPQAFYEFYFDRMIAPDARPNAAHIALANLEAEGKCRAVITQNIDGLHQAAGSKNVLELHGSVHRNHCMNCGHTFALDEMIARHQASTDGVPRCDCGGIIKPDVVLYDEPLDEAVMEQALEALEQASLLVVGGTSLVVYPAAGMLRAFRGSHLAVVNLSPTSVDSQADLCISAKVGEVFSKLS